MSNLAVKIAIIESESGWGRKVDDWMVCQSIEDANEFRIEFNSKNTEESTPNWYMQVEGKPETISLNEEQFSLLKSEGRVWLSTINKLK